MRKITKKASEAFINAKNFSESNMSVIVRPNVTVMALFGNEIAYRYNDPNQTISITSAGWKTRTTKDRLNSIDGVNISQSKDTWYLNGNEWDGNLIDIN